ncbi:MAG TPA: S-4TM family putative pore-forming effector [Gammaproteobacteria bacterium]
MNNIPAKQNEQEELRKLAAMRFTYSSAKMVLFWQFFLSVPVSVTAAILSLAYPSLKGYATFIGLVVTALNLAWLTPWQTRLRKQAANIQEAFDCYVLDLEWNPIKAGQRPLPELIKERADQYFPNRTDFPGLRDWYPIVVGTVRLEIGRIICQRENCVWDAKQRHSYATAMVSFIAACIVAVFVAGMVEGLTVEKWILSVVGPLIPAFTFAWQQGREHRAAATRLEDLRNHADGLVDAVLGGLADGQATALSRSLQDEILDSRQRNAPVFDWVFNFLRPEYEAQMRYGAKELVAKVARNGGGSGSQ